MWQHSARQTWLCACYHLQSPRVPPHPAQTPVCRLARTNAAACLPGSSRSLAAVYVSHWHLGDGLLEQQRQRQQRQQPVCAVPSMEDKLDSTWRSAGGSELRAAAAGSRADGRKARAPAGAAAGGDGGLPGRLEFRLQARSSAICGHDQPPRG